MNQKQAKELVRSRLSDKRYEHTLNAVSYTHLTLPTIPDV